MLATTGCVHVITTYNMDCPQHLDSSAFNHLMRETVVLLKLLVKLSGACCRPGHLFAIQSALPSRSFMYTCELLTENDLPS